MNAKSLVFIASFAIFFLAFRVLENDLSQILVGALAVLVILWICVRTFLSTLAIAPDSGIKIANQRWLQFGILSILGLALFSLQRFFLNHSLNPTMDLGLKGIWFSCLVVGLVGTLFLDHLIQSSPLRLPRLFVRKSVNGALLLSLGFLLLFPTNYIVDRFNIRQDFSFFKTASPGGSTIKVAQKAQSPFVIYIFASPSSEVGVELRDYFEDLKKKAPLRILNVDQLAEPSLSQKLKIRDNGYVVISTEAIEAKDKPTIEDKLSKRAIRPQKIRIGTHIDDKREKEKLRNFDASVRKAMIALERGRLNIYLTAGHGELSWKGKAKPFKNISVFKKGLETYNYRLKTIDSSKGLSEKIPKSARVLFVLGPDLGLSKNEFETIKAYLNEGGSLLLAVEPRALREAKTFDEGRVDYSDALLKWLGLELEEGILLSKKGMQPVTRSAQDRMHFVTKQFSQHPSLSTLNSDRTQNYGLFLSTASTLRILNNEKRKITAVVKSPSSSWMELNRNLEKDAEESQRSRPVGVAIEGEKWRAFVVSDASAFSDFAMQNTGNQQFSLDIVNWLSRLEKQSGIISSQEDKPFIPTKEGQSLWFYGSILGFPFFILCVGIFTTRRRIRTKREEK